MNADCVHTDVVYGAKVNLIDQNDLPVDQEPETYTGHSEDWMSMADHFGSPTSGQKRHSVNTSGI